ncbi:hypothetical protein Q8A73_020952 [Channa argus]|nr:hypothetical protein Q8A73_020952 [Channa argus]
MAAATNSHLGEHRGSVWRAAGLPQSEHGVWRVLFVLTLLENMTSVEVAGRLVNAGHCSAPSFVTASFHHRCLVVEEKFLQRAAAKRGDDLHKQVHSGADAEERRRLQRKSLLIFFSGSFI